MAKQIVTTNKNDVRITQQFNALYRGVGIVVLVTSFYLLLYPIFTGEHILYRGQLDLTFFSIPGIIMGLLAFLSKIVIFDREKKVVSIKYKTLVITFFRKVYKHTDNSKLLLSEDSKQIPIYSQPREGRIHEVSVVPWYLIRLISDDYEVLICKTINANETKDIADSIHELTSIPLIIEENYPQ
jgi:hypothetical protein